MTEPEKQSPGPERAQQVQPQPQGRSGEGMASLMAHLRGEGPIDPEPQEAGDKA